LSAAGGRCAPPPLRAFERTADAGVQRALPSETGVGKDSFVREAVVF
jgi:hypothetical protein